jgi:MFS family permease
MVHPENIMESMIMPILNQLRTILFIVFVGYIGASIAYPIFPPLFLHSSALIPGHSWAADNRNLLLGLTLAVYPLGQFIGSPVIGAMSDKYGRKNILLLTLTGTMLGYVSSAAALQTGMLWLLILSRFATGLAESNLALAQSIIADLDINKHKGFGGIVMASSIGYVVGPMIGGFLSDGSLFSWFNAATPFYIAAILSAFTLYFAYKQLPESRPADISPVSSQTAWRQFNVIAHLQEILQNQLLKYYLLSSLVFTVGVDLFYEFGPVYLTGRWMMDSGQIAVYNLILSMAIALSGAWLPHYLASRFSPRQIVVMAIMLFSFFLSLMTITSSVSLLFPLFALIGLMIPLPSTAITVQLSDAADNDIQGKIMGMQWGLRMLGDALICIFGGFLISISVSLPLAAGVLAVLLAVVIYLLRIEKYPVNPELDGFEWSSKNEK